MERAARFAQSALALTQCARAQERRSCEWCGGPLGRSGYALRLIDALEALRKWLGGKSKAFLWTFRPRWRRLVSQAPDPFVSSEPLDARYVMSMPLIFGQVEMLVASVRAASDD